jgi:hypothetical protein
MQSKYNSIRYKAMFLGFCCLVFAACKDIQPNDPTKIEESIAVQTKGDVLRLFAGIYDVMRSKKFMGGNTQLASEFMGDNIDGALLSGNNAAYYNHTSGIFNELSREIWGDGYLCVYRSNVAIDRLPKVTGLTDAERTQFQGEAKFLRAVAMFEMLRVFAQPFGFSPNNDQLGIVIRTAPSPEPAPRSTVAACYNLIINDLNEAVDKCSAANLPGHASKWAAKAYLAKVYFQMNKYEDAHHNANEVISSGLFLMDTLHGRYTSKKSKEAVFVLVSDGNSTRAGQKYWEEVRFSATGTPNIKLSKAAYDAAKLESPTDLRFIKWYTQGSGSVGTEYRCTKYNIRDDFDNTLASLTELKLIRAECNAEMGMNQAEAVTDINDVRVRAGLAPIGLSTDADLIEAARRERRVEFVMEGHRLQDLKRIGAAKTSKLAVPNLLIRTSPWNCPGMVGQIPDTETAANPAIITNPAGGCN